MNAVAVYEQQVLNEYSRVSSNLNQIANLAQSLASAQPATLEALRPMERKMGLVLTLFKASIWAILVQREEQHDQDEMNREERDY